MKSTLNKRSKVPAQFLDLYDKGTVPFPSFDFFQSGGKNELIHFSCHNWEQYQAGTVPTLCLHGLNGSRLLFADLLDVVQRYYPSLPMIAVDLYGHGLSSCPDKKYNLDLFVGQLEKLLAHLRIEKLNIIGFSLGGAVAVGFAKKFPNRIIKLVLIAPAGFVPFDDHKKAGKKDRREPGGVDYPELSELQSSDGGESSGIGGISSHVKLVKWIPSFILSPIVRSMFKSALTNPHQTTLPPNLPEHIKEEHRLQTERLIWQSFIKKGTLDATISIVKHFPLFKMEKDYEAVGKTIVGTERPVLLIWGEQDRVSPLGISGGKVKKFFKNSFLLRVEDSGHVVLAEQPQIVISSIISFLQSPENFQFVTPN